MNGTITLADLRQIAQDYGVECEITETAAGWHVEYDHGDEDYTTGEEACEALRAYGAGSR